MESPRSPKRRRILSSINPPEQNNAADAPRDPRRDRSMTPTGPPDYGPREPKATKFRFKSSSHHHRHRRRRRSHPSRPDSAPEPENDPPLSPTTAFRESLFDAMADDEGAAYWESVYGQPIHIYAPPHTASGGTGAGGMLEQMTEDEYAAYVRQKMWEKTHAGLMEARARRQREQEEEREKAEERARVNREMERSLRRGEERRKRRGWRERWEKYLERWTVWESEGGKGTAGGGGGEDGDAGLLKEKIPWPIISSGGSTRGYGDEGVDGEAVRAFFVNGIGLEELGEKEFAAQLKEERVRWHPDKMQRRLGGKVDEKIMRDVTAIFQVVDALWNDTRKKSG
ncbi:uncharacterized protein C8A04DRAFT_15053 [Dichotomopilus funicola]|uniref:NF-kappa-B inhibitor-like protein 1 n=1 Tax=Dichotomopilus funicola TaxID=1934379 RepID=A0AAN6UW80_9PEZI|nr:hypothetical protein C8A04DRAFT_15053 [Dichotomopilus funicola]